MSHFIANAISIAKDRKTFRVKGWDNNVVPRSNNWTRDIPITALLEEISSGNIKLLPWKDKNALITRLAKKYDKLFGGSWENSNTFYHLYPSKDPATKLRVDTTIQSFLSELWNMLDNPPKGGCVIHFPNGGNYLHDIRGRKGYLTHDISMAKLFTYERALQVAFRFSGEVISYS